MHFSPSLLEIPFLALVPHGQDSSDCDPQNDKNNDTACTSTSSAFTVLTNTGSLTLLVATTSTNTVAVAPSLNTITNTVPTNTIYEPVTTPAGTEFGSSTETTQTKKAFVPLTGIGTTSAAGVSQVVAIAEVVLAAGAFAVLMA